MFYGLSSRGGCPPFWALKVLQGWDGLCALVTKVVPLQANASHVTFHI